MTKFINLVNVPQRAMVDDEDYEELIKFKWKMYKQGYAVRTTDGALMHRLINKTPKWYETDHINRNRLDNRKSNLRTVTASENQQNAKTPKHNKTGVRGIYLASNGKYGVSVTRYAHRQFLGYFTNLDEAVTVKEAYLKGVGNAVYP